MAASSKKKSPPYFEKPRASAVRGDALRTSLTLYNVSRHSFRLAWPTRKEPIEKRGEILIWDNEKNVPCAQLTTCKNLTVETDSYS